jgi:hypothetical protein
MAKSKQVSSKSASFAKGGSTKMFGKQHAGQQAPGQTATKSGAGGKFAKGGGSKMFGKQSANPRRPGVTGK